MKTAILVFALAAAAAAQTFSIAGIVRDSRTGDPMKRVRVVAATPGRPESAVLTGDDGVFAFAVPKGKYSLTAEYRGLRQAYGQNASGNGFSVAVYTGPDQDTSKLTFRWLTRGAISGKITDDRGEPAQSILVQLMRSMVLGGRKRLRPAGWAYTNDLGEYRFGELTEGTYYLAATGQPWYSQTAGMWATIANGARADSPPSSAYAPLFYPNALDIKNASPLTLGPGAELSADFTLKTVAGVTVTVRCPIALETEINLSLVTGGIDGVQGYQWQRNGVKEAIQMIPAVPPGHYTVRAQAAGSKPVNLQRDIEVGSSDVTVELASRAPPFVSGKLAFKNPETKLRGPIYVQLVDEWDMRSVTMDVGANGEFSFSGVAPGKWRARLMGPGGIFIARLGVEGAALEGGWIEVQEEAVVRLNVVGSDEVGRLRGFVRSDGGAVPGVVAVLAPENGASDPAAYRAYLTDSDGSFDFNNVRAGDYVLFAVDQPEFEFANPEAVRPYLTSGMRVRIAPHSSSAEDIKLSSAARN